MAMTICMDAEAGLARITAQGPVDLPQILDAVDRFYQDDRLQAGMSLLWDFSRARLRLDTPEIRRIAEHVEARPGGWSPRRTALVAGDDLSFGLCRMYEVFASSFRAEVMVFRDLGEAEAWVREDADEPPD